MKPTLKNKIRLWWHCLVRFHHKQKRYETISNPIERIQVKLLKSISCADCGYGLGNHNPDKS